MKEFDASQSEDVYVALAWRGLKSTISWDNLDEDLKANYDIIKNNYFEETSNCN